MEFKLLVKDQFFPKAGKSTVYLKADDWDDFSYTTSFMLALHDEFGLFHEVGELKIGFAGQLPKQNTVEYIDADFSRLPDWFFSVGLDVSYYSKLATFSSSMRSIIMKALNDVAFDFDLLKQYQNEPVFAKSLLRSVSLSVIQGQYRRVLNGDIPLTPYDFSYNFQPNEQPTTYSLDFNVKEGSSPSTNIHAIIGRNGVGKTTLLNGMIQSITNPESEQGFVDCDGKPISRDYFSSLVSISFSAFDAYTPPTEQSDPIKGTCYFYIGLQARQEKQRLKDRSQLDNELVEAFLLCTAEREKKKRLFDAIRTLESDENFYQLNLSELQDKARFEAKKLIWNKMQVMSSGHAIVFLSIVKLVAHVEEKTLVLIDEPESHLHPPLLSAFIRALSELLMNRNGVAIIATHSPVVLQEVPKSCVQKVARVGDSLKIRRPEIETFGENVGVLTREIFGLEVLSSGFHQLLQRHVELGSGYDEILQEYDQQLGLEGRAILKALIMNRDKDVVA